jgi:hypothetical protein
MALARGYITPQSAGTRRILRPTFPPCRKVLYKLEPTSLLRMPPSPSMTMKNTTVMTNILPLLVHAHCTAALPISAGDCRGDMGMACIASPGMAAVVGLRQSSRSPAGSVEVVASQRDEVVCNAFLPQSQIHMCPSAPLEQGTPSPSQPAPLPSCIRTDSCQTGRRLLSYARLGPPSWQSNKLEAK